MRRGRITLAAVALVGAAAFTGAPLAAAASSATPADICKDLSDGHLDGTYTNADWQAFLQDTTVQGYCSPIVVIVPPPPPTTTTTTTPALTPPAPPTTTVTTTVTTPAPATAPVPLVPVTGVQPTVIAQVKGAQHTKPTTRVKGAKKTVIAPKRSAAAPITTTRRSGTLPFTGAQLALFTIVGLALIATGFLLRSTTRRGTRP